MRKAGKPDGAKAVELADAFCRTTRRRVESLFRGLRSNDDVRNYRIARRVLEGEHVWLESGLVPAAEALERFAAGAAKTESELATV